MADPKIRFKRSSVPGKIPNETQVPLGELALNTYDGKVFASKNVGVGTTVFVVNPWSVGAGTDTYNTYFTSGNVGIAETNPTSKLTVTGDVLVSGVVTASSFVKSGGTSSQFLKADGSVDSTSYISGIGINTAGGNVGYGATLLDFRGSGISTITVSSGIATISIEGGVGSATTNPASNYILSLTPAFNGVTTSFAIQYNGNSYTPLNEQQLLLSLGGVIQEPGVVYTVSGSNLYFTSAPNAETDCFIIAINTSNETSVTTSDYSSVAGIATYATTAGVSTNVIGGIGSLTQLNVSGISTLGNVKIGVGTTALIVEGDARITGILTIGTSSITIDGSNNQVNVGTGVTIHHINGVQVGNNTLHSTGLSINQINVSGVITASSFNGPITGTASTATAASTAYGLTGTPDIIVGVATATTFSGSGASLTNLNASNLSSGIVPAARITSTSALNVGGDLYVSGNISFGGTTTQLNTSQVTFSDPDIVLGVGTTSTFNPTDNTANHGGIAIASTEGSPLVNLNINPGEVLPTTYKKFMWFKNNAAGLGTDAWLSNFAVGIGSTQFPTGTRFASGNIQLDANDIKVVRHINSSGVITATSFSGNASSATYSTSAGIATYATTAGIATNVSGGTASVSQIQVTGIGTFTNGPVIIGAGTSTGTASQPLQVTGGGYFSGSIGVGTTNPNGVSAQTSQLTLVGSNSGGGAGYHQFLTVSSTTATNPNKFFRMNSTGSIEIVNSAYTTAIFTFANSGDFTASGNVTGYSDETLKDNIQTIPDALEKVVQLRGVEFDRNDIEGNPHQIGVIAQEVEKVIPEVVMTHEDGIKSVAYGNLVGLLIEAIKELKEEVNELKARLEEV